MAWAFSRASIAAFFPQRLGVALRLLLERLGADFGLFDQALHVGAGLERRLLVGAGPRRTGARTGIDEDRNDDDPKRDEHGQNHGR